MSLPCGTRNYNYSEDMAIVRTKTHWVLLIGFLVILFTTPLYLNNYWLGVFNLIGITLIAAVGLNILVGYCGQLSIGHAGFIAVGAYTAAILTNRLEMPFLVGLIGAGVVSGLIGIIFGLPSVRVKGFYLAITTIAAQFIIIWVINHWGYTGGFLGIKVPYASIGGLVFRSESSQFYLITIIAALCIFFAKNLARAKVGRAFIAIRDNDLAAEVMGINPLYYKLLAFFIGCFFAGIAGALLAHWIGFLNAEQFSFTESILYVGMIIIGGLGTSIGPIFGVIFIRILQQVLTVNLVPFLESSFTAFPSGFATGVTPMLFGLVIVLFLILEPRGLAHRWALFKSAYRLWPFSY
ncbi:MAG TPA: branched-chain amino acid ABC transporter permease [Dehalococcoidales bacterium]|nr:branched-chain amino acid ABC transporter permease [Dehalococcoidales bacterium]